jgi:hypothetical protein
MATGDTSPLRRAQHAQHRRRNRAKAYLEVRTAEVNKTDVQRKWKRMAFVEGKVTTSKRKEEE